MDKHQLSLVLLLSFCVGISACGTTPKPAPEAAEPTETLEDDDGRGFDPCLINPKLAVCNKNEITDQQ